MKKWEYKLIGFHDLIEEYAPPWDGKGVAEQFAPYGNRVLAALNNIGKEGWELIETSHKIDVKSGVGAYATHIFKRERN